MTEEQFEAATGYPPKNDDLERVNCSRAGSDGHTGCGSWWLAKVVVDNLPPMK